MACALTLIMLPTGVSVRATTDGDLGSDGRGIGGGNDALRCQLGKTLKYDYDGIFVGEADVESVQGSGNESATLVGQTTVVMTAVDSRDDLCTYAVELSETVVKQIVRGEVTEATDYRELGEAIAQTYYFSQASDGRIVDVIVGREDSEEVVTFKRGVVNALNVTLRSDDTYEVVESDVSGTYRARYTAARDGETTVFSRSRNAGDYILSKNQQLAKEVDGHQSSSINFDVANGCISQVNIDEVVTITEPDAEDPPVSEEFRHETLRIRAAINMTLMSSGYNGSYQNLNLDKNSEGMVRLPLSAKIELTTESNDNSKVIAELLVQLEKEPKSPRLLAHLTRALRGDDHGIDQLNRYLEGYRPTGHLARALGSSLIGLGNSEAQTALRQLLFDGGLAVQTQKRILGLSALLETPEEALVAAVFAAAQNRSADIWSTANLALGAYAYRLKDSNSPLSEQLVADLNTRLRQVDSLDAAVLLMRALGNAGDASSLPLLAPYLKAKDMQARLSAVVGMRKFETSEVEELLLAHYPSETRKPVHQAIQDVLEERAEAGLNDEAGYPRGVLVDWSWSNTYGGNFANVTASASALVEDEPYLVDVQANVAAEVADTDFDIGAFQLLTERVSDEDRRFRFFASVPGMNIETSDETVTCSINTDDDVWNASIPLPEISTQEIPIIGPLTLKLTVDGSIDFSINYARSGNWCSADGDLQIGMTPSVALYVDGYATLSLLIVRGGAGIDGDAVKFAIPIFGDAEMAFQDAPTVCFTVDSVVTFGELELYAWGQYRGLFGWRPNPRPHWTLWSFTIAEVNRNLVNSCGSNPSLHCLPDVQWWDGSSIDAIWDGANCVVTSPPANSTPFISANSYYIEFNSTCPSNMPWDGTGCVATTVASEPNINISLFTTGAKPRLTFSQNGFVEAIPGCPIGWPQVSYVPGEVRTCETTPPAGFSASDYFLVTNGWLDSTVYITGSAACDSGIPTNAGCRLGTAPTNMSAFYLPGTNLFYYAEP